MCLCTRGCLSEGGRSCPPHPFPPGAVNQLDQVPILPPFDSFKQVKQPSQLACKLTVAATVAPNRAPCCHPPTCRCRTASGFETTWRCCRWAWGLLGQMIVMSISVVCHRSRQLCFLYVATKLPLPLPMLLRCSQRRHRLKSTPASQDRPPLTRDQTNWQDHKCDLLYVPEILNASAVTVPGFILNATAA